MLKLHSSAPEMSRNRPFKCRSCAKTLAHMSYHKKNEHRGGSLAPKATCAVADGAIPSASVGWLVHWVWEVVLVRRRKRPARPPPWGGGRGVVDRGRRGLILTTLSLLMPCPPPFTPTLTKADTWGMRGIGAGAPYLKPHETRAVVVPKPAPAALAPALRRAPLAAGLAGRAAVGADTPESQLRLRVLHFEGQTLEIQAEAALELRAVAAIGRDAPLHVRQAVGARPSVSRGVCDVRQVHVNGRLPPGDGALDPQLLPRRNDRIELGPVVGGREVDVPKIAVLEVPAGDAGQR